MVSLLAATAFPDRIAAQREPGSKRYLLANGLGAELDRRSGLVNAPYLVVTALDGGERSDGRIFAGSALDIDTIRRSFAGRIDNRRRVVWDPIAQRVIAREEETLGALTLLSRAVRAETDEIAAALLDFLNTSGNGSLLNKTPAGEALQARVLFLRSVFPDEWPDVTDEALLNSAADWLPGAVAVLDRPERFSGIDLAEAVTMMLGWQKKQLLDRLAPTHLQAPSGSLIRLDYCGDDQPVMAVKLQELFGLAVTPTVADGRVPVLIHLLSPAGRPMQVTRDLRSFWNSVYPEVKKELKGRYPKHPWPDDPWNAVPTRFTKRRAG
jgi:ATP-dependent helicase HrpB